LIKEKARIFPFEIPNSSKRSERNESFDLQELMKIQVSQGFPRSTRGFISLPLLFFFVIEKKTKEIKENRDFLPQQVCLSPTRFSSTTHWIGSTSIEIC